MDKCTLRIHGNGNVNVPLKDRDEFWNMCQHPYHLWKRSLYNNSWPNIVYAVHKSVGMRCCKSATTVCSRYLLIALQGNDVDDNSPLHASTGWLQPGRPKNVAAASFRSTPLVRTVVRTCPYFCSCLYCRARRLRCHLLSIQCPTNGNTSQSQIR